MQDKLGQSNLFNILKGALTGVGEVESFSYIDPDTVLNTANNLASASSSGAANHGAEEFEDDDEDYEAVRNVKVTHAAYYQGLDPNTIVIPPVADAENQGLELIPQMFAKIKQYRDANNLTDAFWADKKLVIPLALGKITYGFQIKHWVCLHYDVKTKKAFIIDSNGDGWLSATARSLGMTYPFEDVRLLLQEGIKSLCGSDVLEFNVGYQHVQQDRIHCGDWAAINVQALAHGVTVDEQMRVLSVDDLDDVVAHNKGCVAYGKKAEYVPIGKRDSSSFGGSSSDAYNDDEVLLPSAKQKGAWKSRAEELFDEYSQNKASLARALGVRQSIRKYMVQLSEINEVELDVIFEELQECDPSSDIKYSISEAQLKRCKTVLKDKSLGLGIDEACVESLSIKDVLSYDAIVMDVLERVGYGEVYAGLETLETISEDKKAELRDDRELTYKYLLNVLSIKVQEDIAVKVVQSSGMSSHEDFKPLIVSSEDEVHTNPYQSSVFSLKVMNACLIIGVITAAIALISLILGANGLVNGVVAGSVFVGSSFVSVVSLSISTGFFGCCDTSVSAGTNLSSDNYLGFAVL
jgi:hypothetical protein